jgi:Flp pilus assembly protein TadD
MARTMLLRTAGPVVALTLLPLVAGASRGPTVPYTLPAQAPPGLATDGAPLPAPGAGVSAPTRTAKPTPPPPATPAARPARPALRVLPTGGIKVETAALMVSGQEGGPIPLAAVAYPLPGEAGKARVAVIVEIEGSALLAKQSDGLLHADIVLYALDAQGGLAGSSERTVEVDLAQLGGEVRDGGIKFMGEVALPPGEVSLRVMVRNTATGEMGLRLLPINVPAFGAGPVLSAPVLLAAREPWVVVAASGRPGPLAAALPAVQPAALPAGPAASPVPAAGGSELPAALPILTPDRETKAELLAYKLAAGADVRIEVLGSAGRVADLAARTLGRRPTAIPDLEVISIAFTPQGIPEGRYAVRAKAGETGSGLAQFLLLPDGGGGRAWAELTAISRARANGEATPTAGTTAAKLRARLRKPETAALLAAYDHALGRLATGDVPGASAAIADLEVKALTGEETLTELELRELELDALHGWTAGGRDRLTQVLALYELIYRDAWNRQRFLTAGHAGEMVLHLVDGYVKSGVENAQKIGAGLLIALTPRASGAGLSELVQRALNRALDLDRDNETALLCLAVDAERRGHYTDAVRWLERLAKAHPEDREGRLRLALNLEKQGHRQDAERRLRDLAEAKGAESDWIAAVAWQELARAQIADKKLDAAERTITAGLGRLPGDEKLQLERAYLLDLRGEPGRAEEVLGPERTPAPATSGSSARLRYDELPQELLDRGWEELRHGLAARFPALTGILNAPTRSAEVLP